MKLFVKIIKWFFVFLITAILLWFTTSYAMYRITSGEIPITFEGEMRYKFLELSFNNRQAFEELFGNRIIRIKGVPVLYSTQIVRSKLWPESPHDMLKKEYTISAKVSVRPLYFGGYGLAEVVEVEKLHKKPIIEK